MILPQGIIRHRGSTEAGAAAPWMGATGVGPLQGLVCRRCSFQEGQSCFLEATHPNTPMPAPTSMTTLKRCIAMAGAPKGPSTRSSTSASASRCSTVAGQTLSSTLSLYMSTARMAERQEMSICNGTSVGASHCGFVIL